jgi:hypothetical protein
MPEVRYIGGSVYALRGGPTWESGDVYDVDPDTADRLVNGAKFEMVDDDVDEAALIEDGVCPWCSDYRGDNVGMHAARAHADAWADYKGGN